MTSIAHALTTFRSCSDRVFLEFIAKVDTQTGVWNEVREISPSGRTALCGTAESLGSRRAGKQVAAGRQ